MGKPSNLFSNRGLRTNPVTGDVAEGGRHGGTYHPGFISQRGHSANLLPSSTPIAAGAIGAFLTALVPVMWAYSGWHLLGPVGEEVENPGKNLPRALVFSV